MPVRDRQLLEKVANRFAMAEVPRRHDGTVRVTDIHPQEITLQADPKPVGNAVEEALRHLPVTPVPTRLNTDTLQFCGLELPTGNHISLGVAAANRGSSIDTGNTAAFDMTRTNPRHFTFGHGAHNRPDRRSPSTTCGATRSVRTPSTPRRRRYGSSALGRSAQ